MFIWRVLFRGWDSLTTVKGLAALSACVSFAAGFTYSLLILYRWLGKQMAWKWMVLKLKEAKEWIHHRTYLSKEAWTDERHSWEKVCILLLIPPTEIRNCVKSRLYYNVGAFVIEPPPPNETQFRRMRARTWLYYVQGLLKGPVKTTRGKWVLSPSLSMSELILDPSNFRRLSQ